MPRAQAIRRSVNRRLTATVAVLLLTVGLLLVTPTTRASILRFVDGIMLIGEQSMPNEPVEVSAPVAPPGSHSFTTTEELASFAEQKVPILPEPPTGFVFTGGWIDEDPLVGKLSVTMIYHPVDGAITPMTPYLLIEANSNADVMPMLPEKQGQWVEVAGISALYFQGRWQGDHDAETGHALTNIQWNPDADAGWLTWNDRSLNLLIVGDGLGLDQEALVQMAESLSWE